MLSNLATSARSTTSLPGSLGRLGGDEPERLIRDALVRRGADAPAVVGGAA